MYFFQNGFSGEMKTGIGFHVSFQGNRSPSRAGLCASKSRNAEKQCLFAMWHQWNSGYTPPKIDSKPRK